MRRRESFGTARSRCAGVRDPSSATVTEVKEISNPTSTPQVKTNGAVVASSSVGLSIEALKDEDGVWLKYLEENPDKARPLIEKAMREGDFTYFVLIKKDKVKYSQLNDLVRELEDQSPHQPRIQPETQVALQRAG